MTPFSRTNPPRSILVVRLGAVGDIVRTLPAVRLLRRTWPATPLAWAVETGPAQLLRGHPDIDRLILLDRGGLRRAVARAAPRAALIARDFVRELRAFAPELALDFQGALKSGLTSWLSGARVRLGFDRPFARESSHIFANRRVQLSTPRLHRVHRAAVLARSAGAEDAPLEADLALTPEERAAGRAEVARLAAPREAIALAPFSSARQPYKRYPASRWTEVARRLAGAGRAVLVLAGPGEEEAARRLCDEAGAGVVPVTAPPLRLLAAMLEECELFVGGDTGPMHLAWASGIPVVAVFGPTDPALNAPFGPGHCVLAPPRPSDRSAADPFPGITAELVSSRAISLLHECSLPETNP